MTQQQPFLTFGAPEIGEEEIAEVTAVLRSGWVSTGPRARQFEKDFSAYLGGGVESISVNSATAGLHLAMEAIGVGPGDEVIVPTYTFTASAEVVRYLGAHPVFIDCDPATLNITAEAISRAITPRTKAVMPVHISGLACDMDAILAVARKHGLRVIEDAAHALPTTHNGRLIGTFASDATVFSFYANKTMTTGEGGMVVTADAAIAKRCRVMRLHGIDRDAFDRYTSTLPAWYYEIVAPGFKYNMPDIAAALGIHQLRRLDGFHVKRQAMAERFFDALAGLPLILPAKPRPGDKHAWHLFIVRLTDQARVGRDEFIKQMSARGIGTGVHFIPLHRHPYWRDTYKLSPQQFPHADAAFAGTVSLPLYTRMTAADEARVFDAVHAILG
ncbi:MAG: DegT/DnrJ/EryC1/StrS family aminotransferase [Rhodospirillaceae bacterium]|nr:DegT/DnrJ/EryC1/StrS family aminotransferase [Rhodospirillaceae bacterium]